MLLVEIETSFNAKRAGTSCVPIPIVVSRIIGYKIEAVESDGKVSLAGTDTQGKMRIERLMNTIIQN